MLVSMKEEGGERWLRSRRGSRVSRVLPNQPAIKTVMSKIRAIALGFLGMGTGVFTLTEAEEVGRVTQEKVESKVIRSMKLWIL